MSSVVSFFEVACSKERVRDRSCHVLSGLCFAFVYIALPKTVVHFAETHNLRLQQSLVTSGWLK